MRDRKRVMVPIVILAAIALWIPRQQRIAAAQRSLEEKRNDLVSIVSSIEEKSTTLSSLEVEMRQHLAGRQVIISSLAKAEQELTSITPESGWVAPPSDLPHWETGSPYVWVRKETMKQIHMPAFGKDGGLVPHAAPVLGLSAGEMGSMNAKLTVILAEYRKIEVSQVAIVDEHLPGAGPVNGGKAITISWGRSEEGVRFLNQFEAVLRDHLGDQRTDLLLAVNGQELGEMFGKANMSSEGMKITFIRHTNDHYSFAMQEGNSSLSTGSTKEYVERVVEEHIPPHLRPFFAELLE